MRKQTKRIFLFSFLFLLFLLFPQNVRAEEVKFVVAGHIYPGVQKPQLVRAFISQVNELNPNAVFLLGDSLQIVNQETWANLKKELSELEVPYYLAPGNHDLTDDDEVRRLWLDNVGYIHQSIVINNSKIIILHVSRLGDKYILSQEEIDFLKEELRDYQDYSHIFLMLHNELWLYPYINWEETIYPIIKGKVRAVFAGNGTYFVNSFSDQDPDLKYFLTGWPFLKDYKRQATFFLVTAAEDDYQVEPLLVNLPADDPYYRIELPRKKSPQEWLKDYFQGLPERIYFFGPKLLKGIILVSFLAGFISFKIFFLIYHFTKKIFKRFKKKKTKAMFGKIKKILKTRFF